MATSCGLVAITSFFGLIVYVYFIDCDPIVSGATQKPDQVNASFLSLAVCSTGVLKVKWPGRNHENL